jgi:sugar phosphate isomerase/epimerase
MSVRVCVNPFSSVNNSLAEDVELWRSLSVRRVGVSSPKVRSLGWANAVPLLSSAPLEIEYVVHPLYTPVDDEARWETEVRDLLAAVDAAYALGARSVYFCSPPAGALRWEQAAVEFARRLDPVRIRAAQHGVELAVEAVHSSRPEIGFIHTARDAFYLAQIIDTSVCLDLYVHWNERGFAEVVAENLARLAIVQVSDFVMGGRCQPDRVPPGDGDLHMARVLGDVLDAGFDRVVDIELLGPRIEAAGYATAIRRSLEWVEATLAGRGGD